MRDRRASLIAFIAAVALWAPARAAEMSPAMAKVAAAASAEGSVRVMWGSGVLAGSMGAKMIEEGMNRMFGTTVRVLYVPGDSMPQVGNQIMAEAQAKHAASSDVWLAPTTHVGRAQKAGMLKPVDWQALLPGRVSAPMVEADGGAVRFVSQMAGVTYNTKLLPDPPKTLVGFLAPEFKGKIATTPYAAAFDIMATDDFWGLDKTLDFATKLSAQVSALMRCNESSRIADGEVMALLIDCGGDTAYDMADSGAPVAHYLPRDFLNVRYFYMVVPVNAEHPNAATALIAYMLTPEGQALSWRTWNLDLATFPESHSAKLIADAEAGSGKIKELDVAWWLAHPDAAVALDKVIKIFRSAAH
ncbi:MAG TPA: extracellular solute-binding protein [Stellaceae bacterium]|nr:extracellular solute-binding protein [Stellaceae bacterium]